MSEEYVDAAKILSTLSECRRSRVGAVLVGVNGSVIGMGWNHIRDEGMSCQAGDCPRGRMSYEDVPMSTPFTGDGACFAEHAEQHALRNATADVRGATMYVSRAPCAGCAEAMREAGLKAVHYEV